MDAVLDKRLVAASFSRAAKSYDASAELQRDIGLQLLADLPDDVSPNCIVDLGCGTGYFSEALRQRFPDAHIICLDLAEGMLQFARGERYLEANFLCADAEQLPLANQSVDLVFSSLAIQWCENLKGLFSELQRVLKPKAQAFIATLGPQTLNELRRAWQQVDNYTHVNRFAPLIDLQVAIDGAKFTASHIREQTRVLEYQKLNQLTRELKAIGAHNVNRGQSPGLTGRARIEKFRRAYEAQRCNGLLPATYEIFYLNLRA